MHPVKRNLIVLPATLIGASLLGGCGFVHRHFGHKTPAYASAIEARPLEVPPDLDAPNANGALVVPTPSAASASTTGSAATAVPMSTTPGAAPPAAVVAPGVALGGDGLHVADTVESTWSRVGLALERSGAAVILSRDEPARTYAVETTGQTSTKPGLLKRVVTLGRASNKTTAKVQLTVRVTSSAANASTVSVEGADSEAARSAAQALLATLRERLS